MLNDITNQITFGSDSAALADFQQMLHDMRMEGQSLGSFDFNKLLPMPQELNVAAGTRTDRGLKLVREYLYALTDLEQQKPVLAPEDYAAALRQCKELYRKKRMAAPETWVLGEQAYSNIQRFGSREAYEMAAEIMEVALSDYDLHLTKDGISYEYRDPDDAPAANKRGLGTSSAPAEQAKPPKKKRGTKGQDR